MTDINWPMVAAHVCTQLRRVAQAEAVVLVERYRAHCELAIELYGEEALYPPYLAEVVVTAFRDEARATYGEPLQHRSESIAA